MAYFLFKVAVFKAINFFQMNENNIIILCKIILSINLKNHRTKLKWIDKNKWDYEYERDEDNADENNLLHLLK